MGTANALHTHGTGVDGGTDARTARHAQGGLLAVQGPTALDVRTGVLVGPGSTTLITGTSDTAPMTVSLAPHVPVSSRGAANGPYLGPALEASLKVNVTAAPGAGAGDRIDVVYFKQQDKTAGVPTPDGVYAPLYGVKPGTPGLGKPTLTDIPGAVELGTVTVSPGATATNGANVVITNTARQTGARGTRLHVRNQAEEDALTKYNGLEIYRLDNGQVKLTDGSTWATTYDPTDTGAWTAFTPTWTSSGAVPPAVGNGTLTGRYRRVGKTVEISIVLTFGSTTNGGSGNWSFGGLPAALASREQLLQCKAFTAAGNLDGFGLLLGGATATPYLPSTTATQVMAPVRNADSSTAAGTGIPTIAGTFPFANGNNLVLSGSYEAA